MRIGIVVDLSGAFWSLVVCVYKKDNLSFVVKKVFLGLVEK
jgi:hypothetical protein